MTVTVPVIAGMGPILAAMALLGLIIIIKWLIGIIL